MLEYILSFFRSELLFNIRPTPVDSTGLMILISIFGAALIFGVIAEFLIRKKKFDEYLKKGFRKIANVLVTMSILGFVYTFFAYEGATILGARFWILLWAIAFVAWIFVPLKYCLREAPRLRAEREKKINFEKYLPR